MALYIPHSIFHLARLLYVRPEAFGPYYVRLILSLTNSLMVSACGTKRAVCLYRIFTLHHSTVQVVDSDIIYNFFLATGTAG
jgi:hypothetical protein